MDDLIDELMDLQEGYIDAKALLKDCQRSSDSAYICQDHQQDCDELKSLIKETIKRIVEINKGE